MIVMIDDYCEEHGSQGVIEAVNVFIKNGVIDNVMAYKANDRGWVFGRRSTVVIPESPIINSDYINILLKDTESHYD